MKAAGARLRRAGLRRAGAAVVDNVWEAFGQDAPRFGLGLAHYVILQFWPRVPLSCADHHDSEDHRVLLTSPIRALLCSLLLLGSIMVTTRRNGGSTPNRSLSNPQIHSSNPKTMSGSSQNRSSAFTAIVPTSLEAILLAIYPILLVLGSLFSLLDPSARAAPYNPTTQSHPPSQAPAYFALKSNVLNVYFVKIAWVWVTLAYVLFVFLHPMNGPVPRGLPILTPKRLRGMVRYGIVTLWWTVVTQWCFGPALIDRGFRVTGGACEMAAKYEGTGGGKEFVSSQACKQVGGVWKGGHDISGHVFILVLGSAFLALELLPVLARKSGLKEERRVVRKTGEVAGPEGEVSEEENAGGKLGTIAPGAVVGLSWWMLLMTAAYFHTWFEKVCVYLLRVGMVCKTDSQKFTGLLTALVGISVVFFLPRIVPPLRDLIGMPGI